MRFASGLKQDPDMMGLIGLGLQGASPTCMTDVYSFGVTMFEIFTRQEPYDEYQDVEMVAELLGDPAVDPPLRPTIPDNLPTAV